MQYPVYVVGTVVSLFAVALAQLWPPDYASEALKPGGLDGFDFVVIGAGAAGSIIAKRLSENPKWKVLVLSDESITWIGNSVHAELNGKSCMATEWMMCNWPSDISATKPMFYLRGDIENYNDWLKQGNLGWGWNDVKPYFDKSVSKSNSSDQRPSSYVVLHEHASISRSAMDFLSKSYGFFLDKPDLKYYALRNGYQELAYTTMRQFEEVARRPNLQILKNAMPIRFNLSNGTRVDSVSFLLHGEKLNVTAKKEVILAAGPFRTAQLLMLSGIGPKDHLRDFNIPVVYDFPIGHNLQDHLVVPLFVEHPVSEVEPLTEKERLKKELKEKSERRGPFSEEGAIGLTHFHGGIQDHFIYIKKGDNVTLHSWSRAFNLQRRYEKHLQSALTSSNLLIINVGLLHSKAVGRVELRTAHPLAPPKISTNFLQDPADRKQLLDGIHYALNHVLKGYTEMEAAKLLHVPIEECDQHEYKSDSYWLCYMKYFSASQHDHVGTIKMGAVEYNTSCVGNTLRLYGISNLRVADASIMPNIPSSEVHAATLMIAERAADFIRSYWAEREP